MSFEIPRAVLDRPDATLPGLASRRTNPLRHKSLLATETESPVGRLMLTSSSTHLCGLTFLNRNSLDREVAAQAKLLGRAVIVGENEIARATMNQLSEYFSGVRKSFELPIQLSGTAFQRQVWEALMTVPYGKTVSYGELAAMIDRPNAYRAVGNANGANRITIIYPCHRVIATGGKLGGYGGSLWRKEALLELEQANK